MSLILVNSNYYRNMYGEILIIDTPDAPVMLWEKMLSVLWSTGRLQ